MENQNEPKLGEYGLDAISYLKHRKKIDELISLKKSFGFTFWNYLFYIILPLLLVLYYILNLSFLISIIISIVFLMFFEIVRDFFNKRNENYKEIENRINSYKENTNVGAFENALLKFCSNYIEHYYNNYIFRKHIGWKEGMKLSSLMREARNITKYFDKNLYTIGYEKYLMDRFNINPHINYEKNSEYFNFSKILNSINKIESKNEIDTKANKNAIDSHINESVNKVDLVKKENDNNFTNTKIDNKKEIWVSTIDDVNEEIDRSNNPTNSINKVEEKDNIIDINPPETKYKAPRKIDWDSVNQTKKITGLKGEEIVLEMEKSYLNSIGMKELSGKVRHVSKEVGDGLGYDILSYFADGQEKYIEVKSSNRANNNSFYISQNELDFMKNNKNNYVIYRIFNINENEEMPTLRVHRADDILGYKQIIPSQYIVKMD